MCICVWRLFSGIGDIEIGEVKVREVKVKGIERIETQKEM
jgi:hypothetical protein